ncbi:Heme NO binding protein [Jannaschia seosinensis]|uniref:Heme NO binding protein n=1 Tax=Jannaschia seosinensis TaxID=313367 RepID=A0A0M7B6M0_9RHOB|nr:heme NO-binding domain-containing protein [Jannaschia seosinensis]CUH21304.1 Heme NO binding protein [Jannaschia seosinensis]
MHGLICKSLEGFVRDRHGEAAWRAVLRRADVGLDRFEMLRIYDDDIIFKVVFAAAHEVNDRPCHILEDVGHWLCTHTPMEPFRRLIRFSGATFIDLVYSLDETRDRAAMALPDIDLPEIDVFEPEPGGFDVTARWSRPGAAWVLRGILRAMADDYGTLAVVGEVSQQREGSVWVEHLSLEVYEQAFQEPREFALGGVT